MRDASLRWGLGIGGAGSALGIVVLFIAARLLPISSTDTNQSFELVMGLILIQILIGFGMFGVMLSGAYYAGVRVERERLAALREEGGEEAGALPKLGAGATRRDSLIAGVIVMLCYWFVSTLFGLLAPAVPQSAATRGSAFDIVERALVSGAFFLIFGAAMGSLGGRSGRARADVAGASGGTGRSLLDRIAIPPLTPPQSVQSVVAPSSVTPSAPAADVADAPVVSQSPRPFGE